MSRHFTAGSDDKHEDASANWPDPIAEFQQH